MFDTCPDWKSGHSIVVYVSPIGDNDPTCKTCGVLCADCFVEVFDFDPNMGDGETTFQPGTCSKCKRDMIVFSFIED